MSVAKFLKDAQKLQEQHHARAAEKEAEAPHDDESNWLVSYADMMTLLCGFFIMMFSMAKLDEPKFEAVKEAVSKTFRGEYKPPETKELAKALTDVVQEAGLGKDTVVRWDPTGTTIEFQSKVFFDSLSADVKPQGTTVLNRLIGELDKRQKEHGRQYKVVVEGHTDSQPIASPTAAFPTNWELSSARASRVVRLFADHGFAPGRLTAIGYGDTRPEAPSRLPNGEWDEAGLAKNRRVVLRILDAKVEAIPFPDAIAEAPAPVGGAPARAPGATAQATPGAAAPAAPAAAAAVVPPPQARLDRTIPE